MCSIPERGVLFVILATIALPVPWRQGLQLLINSVLHKTPANLAAIEPDLRVTKRLVDNRTKKNAPKCKTAYQRPQLPVTSCCCFEKSHHELIFHSCIENEFSKSVSLIEQLTWPERALGNAWIARCDSAVRLKVALLATFHIDELSSQRLRKSRYILQKGEHSQETPSFNTTL